ncbi:MAG: hypothetical protein K6T65_10345, partial [Peptococcaceae bacterium]|nr:hypothetical protein [Peptococcaceae bacterium]
ARGHWYSDVPDAAKAATARHNVNNTTRKPVAKNLLLFISCSFLFLPPELADGFGKKIKPTLYAKGIHPKTGSSVPIFLY